MSTEACPEVVHCLASLNRSVKEMAALHSSLQLIYGRAAARQFEACLRDQEERGPAIFNSNVYKRE